VARCGTFDLDLWGWRWRLITGFALRVVCRAPRGRQPISLLIVNVFSRVTAIPLGWWTVIGNRDVLEGLGVMSCTIARGRTRSRTPLAIIARHAYYLVLMQRLAKLVYIYRARTPSIFWGTSIAISGRGVGVQTILERNIIARSRTYWRRVRIIYGALFYTVIPGKWWILVSISRRLRCLLLVNPAALFLVSLISFAL
jgi:hypothetical protein